METALALAAAFLVFFVLPVILIGNGLSSRERIGGSGREDAPQSDSRHSEHSENTTPKSFYPNSYSHDWEECTAINQAVSDKWRGVDLVDPANKVAFDKELYLANHNGQEPDIDGWLAQAHNGRTWNGSK
jgi:hypothetical protein